MRIRNVKDKDNILNNNSLVVKDYKKYKGKFKELFNNDNPIHLEIGSGKCRFLKECAKTYKDINFIGIERNKSVLALGLKDDFYLPNLRFINIDASSINEVFSKEITTLYLNFIDPWPKKRHSKRRLTSNNFLEKYDDIFKSDAYIIMKTDNKDLFRYSLVTLSNYGYILENVNLDLQNEENNDNIMTEYEVKYTRKGNVIYRVMARKKLK